MIKLAFAVMLLVNAVTCYGADYTLGVGDEIEITVYNEPDLSKKIKIDKSGVVSIPFLPAINVIGLTPKRLAQQIHDGLEGDYLINPQVFVNVLSYRPFFIHGQIKRPGGYAYQEDLDIGKAIAIAGGLAPRASRSNWLITRKVEGKTVVLQADISTKVFADDIVRIEQSFF
ncbi:polysaccharide biosynthesis/export family protein [Thalassotalea sp. PLHSN55]|uniref:polysaccharide biosynthesis/export family protein n=1 Tax=Thalassotalea sp. PLHSN55 TaxID=3435888 RepID=UPI003F8448DE